jgi:hypothetical protein
MLLKPSLSLASLARVILLTTATLAHASSTPHLASIKAIGRDMLITTPNGTGTVLVDGDLNLKEMFTMLLAVVQSDKTTKASCAPAAACLSVVCCLSKKYYQVTFCLFVSSAIDDLYEPS